MIMKKVAIWLMVMVLCLSMTACKGKDENQEEDSTVQDTSETADDTEDQADTSEDDETDKEEAKYFTLYTEDKSFSVEIQCPQGYEPLEYMSDTWFAFGEEGAGEASESNYSMYLTEDDTESVESAAYGEVSYAITANVVENDLVSDVQTGTWNGLEISYFEYYYEGPDCQVSGCRMWTELDNGAILVAAKENAGEQVEKLDIEATLQDWAASIKQ